MNKATAPKPRLALMQFGNPDGSFREIPYGENGLEKAVLCGEDRQRLDPLEHRRRAVDLARSLPRGARFIVNAEHYGAKNLPVACEVLEAVAKASPGLELSAYVPGQTLSVGAAIGWDPAGRRASAKTAIQTARSLRSCGATFASIDGYMRLDNPPARTGIRQYLATTPFDTWCLQVGEAASVVEGELPPVLWISNRLHPNGVKLDPVAKPDGSPDNLSNLEPFVTPDEFMKMFLFAEHRGWGSIALLGWSGTLWDRTRRGFLPLLDRDLQDLRTLKTTARPS